MINTTINNDVFIKHTYGKREVSNIHSNVKYKINEEQVKRILESESVEIKESNVLNNAIIPKEETIRLAKNILNSRVK